MDHVCIVGPDWPEISVFFCKYNSKSGGFCCFWFLRIERDTLGGNT